MIVFFLGVSVGIFVVLILQAGSAYREAKHCRVPGTVTVAELIARDDSTAEHTLKFEADSFGATEQYGDILATWNAEIETEKFLIPMHVDRR